MEPNAPDPNAAEDAGSASTRRWTHLLMAMFGFLFLLAGLTVVGIAGLLYYFEKQAYVAPDQLKKSVRLQIEPGSSLKTIAQTLQEKGLVKNRYVFLAYVYRHQLARKLQAGDYRLHNQLSVAELARALQQGHWELKATFPEGLTIEQIAQRMVRAKIIKEPSQLLDLRKDRELIDKAGVNAETLEGYLFPDTYFFEPGMNVRQIVERMVRTFRNEADDVLSSPTLVLGEALSREELVTLASMIEREARSIEEMPLMASVYYNRMRKKMPLQCDATIRYALGTWSRALTLKDLQFDSPYNTYRHKGLPPGPICNPSLDAMKAAANPASSEYLFYVYRGDGRHEYTRTYKEHQAATKRFFRGGGEMQAGSQRVDGRTAGVQ